MARGGGEDDEAFRTWVNQPTYVWIRRRHKEKGGPTNETFASPRSCDTKYLGRPIDRILRVLDQRITHVTLGDAVQILKPGFHPLFGHLLRIIKDGVAA